VHSLDDLGWNHFFESQLTDDDRARHAPARVVWEARERYRLATAEGEWRAQLAGRVRHEAGSSADLPAVGDWVIASLRSDDRTATIHRRLSRQTAFSRTAAGRSTGEQVVAANVDTILLVTSFNRDFNVRRLERYLALTWESGARPIVVLNKADLEADRETWRQEVAAVAQGVPCVITSALRGEGIGELRAAIGSGTAALLGSSGVGKSTLVNALAGDDLQTALPIRDGDDRGRHATTTRQLFCLPGGGVLIDTPGMRELQLWDAEAGVEHVFADLRTLAEGCRFRDCSHGGEPGCAVAAAIESGVLEADRFESFQRLQREEEHVRLRHDEQARTERTRRIKQTAKALKLLYKLRKR
jgi:ribosome biogenesis GTPase / thiamine phosphate phosphatase